MVNSPQTVVPFSSNHSLEIDGRHVHLRPDGRLQDLSEWSPQVAQLLAARDGLTLVSQHWKVINAMREYYSDFNVSPVKKLLKRVLKDKGCAALSSDAALEELFPGGVLQQGSRIAGVPVPQLDAELDRARDTRAQATSEPSHFVERFEFNGQPLSVTCTGNLLELHRWSPELARFMASKEGIELTADHWEVLNFLRSFYFEFGVTPMVKLLMKHMAEEVEPNRASRDHLYRLFPRGPSRQGSRIAGLPEPQGCIDG